MKGFHETQSNYRLEEDGRDQGQGHWMSAEVRGQPLSFLEVAIPLLFMLSSMAFPIYPHYQLSSQTLLPGSPYYIGQATVPGSGQG